MRIANKVLHALGATQVVYTSMDDPTNADEFAQLQFVSPTPITWEQYIAKYPEISQKFGMRYLRGERDARLKNTDWVMTVDNAETLANLNDWKVYRQALRDITINPPTFVWGNNGQLDFSSMNMPVEPPILRN